MIWTKLKILAMGLGAITIAGGLGIAATRHLKAGEEPPNPVVRPAPAPDKAATAAPLQPPVRVRPGDNFLIEVLESLPGRPITGERMVRPDGTISLGFYGDLMVVGLDRHEIKVKVIEHLRKYLTDAQLGLVRKDPKSGELVEVVPADSGHVFVDDSEIENARLRARVSGILPGIDFVHDSDIENVRPAAPSVIERRTLVKPGDLVLIEVLQAAQGRPITGHRRVRPDGTLSLGFYGDIQVAGLDRREIKAKVIERLRPYASDGQLGLIRKDPKTGQKIRVDPADSDCVFVDESVNLYAEGVRNRRDGGTPERLKAIESKLDQLIRAVERLGGRGMR